MKVGKLGWLVAMFLSGGMAVAQGTADDYRRAYALKEKFSADKVFYSNVNPQWIEGTHQFWYVRNTPDGCLYVSVDADKKARKELFDSHRLAKALGAASGKEVKPEALALGRLSVSKGLDTLRFVFNNQRWMYASRKNQLVNEGELVLETLVIDGDENTVLVPGDRYAQMRNVYFIPSALALKNWLKKCGFVDIRIADVSVTTTEEQRRTEWMVTESLADFLDPHDPGKTVEGYPAPKRAVLIARKP